MIATRHRLGVNSCKNIYLKRWAKKRESLEQNKGSKLGSRDQSWTMVSKSRYMGQFIEMKLENSFQPFKISIFLICLTIYKIHKTVYVL